MNVTIIGAGYVGLVSGCCFAEFGASVTCVDLDESRIAALKKRPYSHLRARFGSAVGR